MVEQESATTTNSSTFLYDSDTCEVPKEDVLHILITSNVNANTINLCDCPNLQSIQLPPTLTHIPSHAFESCTALPSIDIPKSVKTIGECAFRYCFELKSIVIPDGVRIIEKEVFNGCSALTYAELPESIEEIQSYAFSPCVELQEIWIPFAVRRLGNGVFCDCKSMKNVYFGRPTKNNMETKNNNNGIDQESSSATAATSALLKSSALIEIGDYAFNRCEALQHIKIPPTCQKIGKRTFNENYNLESINIPEGITTIHEGTFQCCSCLLSVTLPQSSLCTIKKDAFQKCRSLISIHIPPSVQCIEENAFDTCVALQLVRIPKHVQRKSNLFNKCSMFKKKDHESYMENDYEWFQRRFENLPIHQACYDLGFFSNTEGNTSTSTIKQQWSKLEVMFQNNLSSLCTKDDMGFTPLHILCCHPYVTSTMIQTLHTYYPKASQIRNKCEMTPLDMYLVTKGVLAYHEFDDIKDGIYDEDEEEEYYNEKGDRGNEYYYASFYMRKIVNASFQNRPECDILDLCKTGLSGDIIHVILALYESINLDSMLEQKRGSTGMYPFMEAAMMTKCSLGTLYTLASTRPDLLKKEGI